MYSKKILLCPSHHLYHTAHRSFFRCFTWQPSDPPILLADFRIHWLLCLRSKICRLGVLPAQQWHAIITSVHCASVFCFGLLFFFGAGNCTQDLRLTRQVLSHWANPKLCASVLQLNITVNFLAVVLHGSFSLSCCHSWCHRVLPYTHEAHVDLTAFYLFY